MIWSKIGKCGGPDFIARHSERCAAKARMERLESRDMDGKTEG